MLYIHTHIHLPPPPPPPTHTHTQLFSSIIKQDIGFFDKSRTGELTNRLASDTQVIQNAVTVNISMLARYTLQMLLSISLMFYISPRLTAVLLSVVPVIAVSAVQYGKLVTIIVAVHVVACSLRTPSFCDLLYYR